MSSRDFIVRPFGIPIAATLVWQSAPSFDFKPGSEATSGNGSIKFATGNLTAAGQTSVLKQSTANLTNVLTEDGSGFVARVYIDFDRMNRNNYYQLWGTGAPNAGGGRFQMRFGPNALNSSAAGVRRRFQVLMRRFSGTAYDFVSGTMPEISGWYDVWLRRSTGGVFQIDVFDMAGTKISDGSGSAFTQAAGGVDSFRVDHLYIGDAIDPGGEATTATARTVNGNVGVGFEGAIAFIGIVNTAVSDADCIAIASGEDVITRIGAANFQYARRLRGTDTASLSPIEGTGDTTAPATVIGSFLKGGTPGRQGTSNYITLNPVSDYHGFGVNPDTLEANVPFVGDCGGVGFAGTITEEWLPTFRYRREVRFSSGTIQGRFIGEDGVPVSDWQLVAATSATGITEGLNFTENSRSAPSLKLAPHGQSQVVIWANAKNLGVTLPDAVMSMVRYETGTQNNQAVAFQTQAAVGNLLVSDGAAAMVQMINAVRPGAVTFVINALSGSDALDMMDDWSRTASGATIDTEDLYAYAGNDITIDLWQWFTTNQGEGGNFGPNILDAVFNNTGPNATGRKMSDIRSADTAVVISPATRQAPTSAGPLDSDPNGTIAAIRPSMRSWAAANNAAIGPEITDMKLDAGEGPHQDPDSVRGNVRLGIRMGEGVLRALGLSSSSDPTIGSPEFNANRTTITLTATLPNAGSTLRVDDTATYAANVQGFEISTDSGLTWSRSGFVGSITGSTVVLVKSSGSWPSGARIRYAWGSPFGYGTSLEASELIRGGLYDGSGLEGGLGLPILPMASVEVTGGSQSTPAPQFTTNPSISGTPQVGQTLTGSDGTITNGTVQSRQWRRGGSAISGATGTTYVQVEADIGANITLQVTATGAGGSANATSAAVGPVTGIAPAITSSSITGTPEDGQTLTANATATGSPTPTLSRQWQRGGTNISGATGATLVLNAATQGWVNGDVIRCVITATNSAGSDDTEPTRTFVAAAVSPVTTKADELALILSGAGNSGIWLPTGTSTMFSDSGRTSSIAAGSGSAIGSISDYSGNGNHLVQATTAHRPVATAGMTLAGTDKTLDFPMAGTSDMTVLIGFKGSDAAGILFAARSGGNFFGCYDATSGSTRNPSFAIDNFVGGSAVANNRSTLQAALNTGAFVRAEFRNADLASFTTLQVGDSAAFANFDVVGAISAIVFIDNTALSGSDLTDALARAQELIDLANTEAAA